jgi:hypothetical protein
MWQSFTSGPFISAESRLSPVFSLSSGFQGLLHGRALHQVLEGYRLLIKAIACF